MVELSPGATELLKEMYIIKNMGTILECIGKLKKVGIPKEIESAFDRCTEDIDSYLTERVKEYDE